MTSLNREIVRADMTIASFDALLPHIPQDHWSESRIPSGDLDKNGFGITDPDAWHAILKKMQRLLCEGARKQEYRAIFDAHPNIISIPFSRDTFGIPLNDTNKKLTKKIMGHATERTS
ncbi:MAG: hypothetical protein K8F92_20920 [Hyphomicrobium sp.]|uniref:hypothetical protein n=1 Tax=Hyphomicrobium sp. TaxID=82 RepID=UPI0013278777|nr:hypothetical protein [Hyphomicrobium sp.]KAB2941440.1 MAG: hypothetical protein F9K20_10105 [Hyphomicrobium sp.]MBZ0212098.1 hypothetical protein [Hyphomicrobium sp.]